MCVLTRAEKDVLVSKEKVQYVKNQHSKMAFVALAIKHDRMTMAEERRDLWGMISSL